jgi:hypothetical protein
MRATDTIAGFQPSAKAAALAALTRKLGCPIPSDLHAVLTESDGVQSLLVVDGRQMETGWLLWPVKTIGKESPTLAKEAKRATGAQLVFFAPGDDVTFAMDEAGAIFAWYDIDAALRPVANSLGAFVDGWCSGSLSV